MRRHSSRSGKLLGGFTLVELLVCIAMVAILAGLLLPSLAKGKNLAVRSHCLSNLRQIGVATSLYLNDNRELMPYVPDTDLQLTPPVSSSGKRYNSMGSFMPLLHPFLGDTRLWISPPVKLKETNEWQKHFQSPWRENGIDSPALGQGNYISDKLAEMDSNQARYLRGRSPESCATRRQSSVSSEEWLMSPFFERGWWSGFARQWAMGSSVPPSGGWSAHSGGRNQLYLDFHADWVRKDILR